jgi:hypothetical protein
MIQVFRETLQVALFGRCHVFAGFAVKQMLIACRFSRGSAPGNQGIRRLPRSPQFFLGVTCSTQVAAA